MWITFEIVDVKLARLSWAGHSSESFKLASAQSVEPLVSGRVLDEPGLVAEPVVAVLAHAVEMGLVFAVVAARKAAIFVESATKNVDVKPVTKEETLNSLKGRNYH